MTPQSSALRRCGRSEDLVVILHAFRGGPRSVQSICEHVQSEFPDADQYVPQLPCHLFSRADPERIAREQLAEIDRIQASKDGGYRSVVFVGHSIGGLLARRIFLLKHEREQEAGSPGEPAWADHVSRIVLLAGMNRGWSAGHHLSPLNYIQWRAGAALAGMLNWSGKAPFLIMSIRRGAPFITKLRVGWIRAANAAAAGDRHFPRTVQLLGSVDDMVAPSDNIDLVSGRSFHYLDVPYSGHASVVRLDDQTPVMDRAGGASTAGNERRKVLSTALTADPDTLDRAGYIPSDRPLNPQNRDITDVVFVIHGIRDVGHWTQKIARAIMTRHKETHGVIRMASETSSYGFFPMLPFLLPWERRRKVEWFMDQYAEALAEFPGAHFSFVGHSNGTYLLARALRDYPFCRFKNVVFAGSVVRSDYDWAAIYKRGQVQRVLNFVATSDWVVAIFPKAIELLRLQDLGSGGHDGFDEDAADNHLFQVRYVRGQHSAALVEENWNAIAEFVVTGETPQIPTSIRSEDQSAALARVSRFAPVVWLILIALVTAIGAGIWVLGGSGVSGTILTGLYLVLVWKVVTRL